MARIPGTPRDVKDAQRRCPGCGARRPLVRYQSHRICAGCVAYARKLLARGQ